MEENQLGYQAFPELSSRSGSHRPLFIFLAIIIILIVAILAGLYILGALQNSAKKNSELILPTKITTTATPLPTSSVSAVLTPNLTGSPSGIEGLSSLDKASNLNRSKLRVAVLNGSGEKGAAGKLASYLGNLGYKIIRTGNADSFTYQNVSILVKSQKKEYASLLKKDIQANPLYASVSASISDEIAIEAEVIVGK